MHDLAYIDSVIENELVQIERDVAKGVGSASQMKAATTEPKPFVVQIPLVDVLERIKRVKADAWQRDFCNRLQEASEKRHIKGIHALIHAQPQLGKSIILAQTLPIWLFGHEPLHRYGLATYNIKRSQRHANVAIRSR